MPKFYTINTNNTSLSDMPLTFDITTNQNLLKKPSDWTVSVIRFSMPNYNTPIFTFIPNRYQMTMEYDGNTTSSYVNFVPFTSDPNFHGVYEIQDYVYMLNKTIDTLFTQMNLLTTLPTTDQSYFHYSETTTLLSYTANKNYYATDGTVAKPILIYLNSPLFQQVQGLPVYSDSSKGFELLVEDFKNGNVSGNYYTMTSQQPFFQQLTDFSGIVITSNLPVVNEYIGYTNSGTVAGSQTQQIALPILQDYSPSGLTVGNFHEPIVYNAVVPYRQTDIISDTSFNNISIQFYTTNTLGVLSQVTLPPSSSANIKLMFTEKKTNHYA